MSVLLQVCTLGYASTRDLASLGWPTLLPKSAHKAAQLVCKAFEADKYIQVTSKQGFTDDKVYVLTHKGARFLCNAFTSLAFKPSYDVEVNRLVHRRPVIDLASAWAKGRGLGVVGARGLSHDVFGLGSFAGLDALLVDSDDPDTVMPAFGILHVRTYDPASVARAKAVLLLPVPVLFAGAEQHQRTVAALVKLRAQYAPAHEAMVQANKPEGVGLC